MVGKFFGEMGKLLKGVFPLLMSSEFRVRCKRFYSPNEASVLYFGERGKGKVRTGRRDATGRRGDKFTVRSSEYINRR